MWFDTDESDNGPDWAITWGIPNDGVGQTPDSPVYDGNDYHAGVSRVDSWEDALKTSRCSLMTLSIDYRLDEIEFRIPRRCLGYPDRLRWTVEAARMTKVTPHVYYTKHDDLPAYHRLPSTWVEDLWSDI